MTNESALSSLATQRGLIEGKVKVLEGSVSSHTGNPSNSPLGILPVDATMCARLLLRTGEGGCGGTS